MTTPRTGCGSRRLLVSGSYDSPTVGAGSVVNEVEMAYNGLGQLVTEYQEHSGAVNASTTPKVQYAYADGSDNHVRPMSVTYPGGRTIDYDYGSAGSSDDAASRVQSIKDGTLALASYSYLGRQTTVEVDYSEPDLKYTLVDLTGSDDPDTGDIYSGLDRFGRVKDSRWYDYAGSADVDRIKYGYDRAGNRTYREMVTDSNDAHDELYGHDGTHRLSDFDRGSLNAAKDAISSLQFAQEWSLDPTGNWAGFKEDSDGDSTWDLDQSRSHNEANEITGITETAGSAWATPAHDRAGNMTTLPQPADPTQTYSGVWDGWNRLVKLVDDATSNTVQENAYDGRKFRVLRKDYAGSVLDETRHFYYTIRWQVIEERLGTSPHADRQFVWGRRYIDDLMLRERDTTANGTLDERLYALQDGNRNVTAVADSYGTVRERYAYTAYGEPKYLDGGYAARSGSSYGWGYLYTGRYLDAVSAIYYFRNRMYDAIEGRFLGRDPIAYRGSEWNLYEYVTAGPLDGLDPSGLRQPPISAGDPWPIGTKPPSDSPTEVPALSDPPSLPGDPVFPALVPPTVHPPTVQPGTGTGGTVHPKPGGTVRPTPRWQPGPKPIGLPFLGPLIDLIINPNTTCPHEDDWMFDDDDDDDECLDQWESDTTWCDRNYRGYQNVACHQWAMNEMFKCQRGEPRTPFDPPTVD